MQRILGGFLLTQQPLSMTCRGLAAESCLSHPSPPLLQEMNTKLLQAALALHEKVAGTFRKTAVNFHYEFTVRHLANVFQGLLMSTPDQFNNVTKLSRLWLHESERVYADRLVSAAVGAAPAEVTTRNDRVCINVGFGLRFSLCSLAAYSPTLNCRTC